MTGLDSTSFDRFARYSYLRELRALLPAPPLRVLDVGDPYGTLSAVLPDDDTVSLDLFHEGWPNVGRNSHVCASGFHLPFPDRAFDVVASHDVVEHLPPGSTEVFVAELLRVSRGPVVLVAPFADPRTAQCEAIVRAWYRSRAGRPLEPLEEHAEGDGLPDGARLESWLRDRGLAFDVYAGGWLYHWVALMLLKAQFAATGDIVTDRSVDAAFIEHLTAADEAAPHYRRAFVIRPPGPLARPPAATSEPADAVEAQRLDLADVAWLLAGALDGPIPPMRHGSAWRTLLGAGGALEQRAPRLAASLRTLVGSIDVAVGPEGPDVPVTVVVPTMPGGPDPQRCVDALRPQVRAVGGEIVVVVGAPDPRLAEQDQGQDVEVVVEQAPDRILRMNRGVEVARGRAVLFLDPGLAVPPDLIASLLEAYHPELGVAAVAVRIEGTPHSPLRAGLASAVGPYGPEALYAPKEGMLIGRSHYSALGGLDGALRGALDDVELGMRIRRRGERIRLAGPRCRWRQPPPAWDPAQAGPEAAAALRILYVTTPAERLWARLAPEVEAASGRLEEASRLVSAMAAAAGTLDPDAAGVVDQLDAAAADLARRRAYVDAGTTVEGPLDLAFGGLHLATLTGDGAPGPVGPVDPVADVLVVADGPRLLALAAALRQAVVGRVEVQGAEQAAKTLRDRGPSVVVTSEAAYARDQAAFELVAHLVLDTGSAHVERSGPLRAADALVCSAEEQRGALQGGHGPGGTPFPVAVAFCVPEPEDMAAAHRASGRLRRPVGAVVVDARGAPAGAAGEPGAAVLADVLARSLGPGVAVHVLVDVGPGAVGTPAARRTTDPMILASATVVAVPPSLAERGWSVEALGWGVPVVTTASDPAARVIAAYGAGACARGEDDLAATVADLAAHPVRLARAGAAAALLAVETRSAAAAELRRLPGLAALAT